MALRDMYLSDYYFKKITLNRSLMAVQNIKGNFSNFDEISLTIVDGNFQNMGSLLYANKILLRHLGYKHEQIYQQTVHLLMPREIALVHDKFWNRFRDTGIPSILEKQRILFIKDSNGQTHPFNIFVRFIYHQKYGYTFLGIFKKLNKMIMSETESPVRLSQMFFFITNQQGKITEISENSGKIIGLNQQIFENLSSYLEEGLHPHHFNPNLSISSLDFTKGPCVIIKKAIIDTSIVIQHNKELELEIDQDARAPIKKRIQVQIKVIKETYGQNDVTLYYFMFSVIKEPVTATIKDGLFEKLFQKNILGAQNDYDSLEYNKFTDSINTRSAASLQYNFNSQSISSQSQSALSQGFDELKYLEDNIDYQKTPKSLLIVKLIFNSIIMMIVALTTAQIILNQIQISHQKDQLGVIKTANENMVLLSELSILVRSYININNGLEPSNSLYFQDRRVTVVQQSLEIIEEMRLNQKDLDFIHDDDPSDISVTIKEKNKSGQYIQQQLSFNYALNQYLVKCLDLFGYSQFTSKELSFLQKSAVTSANTTTGGTTSIFDQTVYYVITNENADLRHITQGYAKNKGEDINDKNVKFLEITRIFLIVASCCILIGVIAALYFYSKIIDNQSKTLAFFSELSKDLIEFCIQGSQSFNQFLTNDNEELIFVDSQIINQRKEVRIKELERQLEQIQDTKSQKLMQNCSDVTYNPNENSDATLISKNNKHTTKIHLEELKDDEEDYNQQNQLSSARNKNSKKMEAIFNASSYSRAKTYSKKKTGIQAHKSTHNLAEIMQNQNTVTKNRFRELDKKIKSIHQENDQDEKGKKYKVSNNEEQSKTVKMNTELLNQGNSGDLRQIFMHWKLKKMGLYSSYQNEKPYLASSIPILRLNLHELVYF